MPYLASIGFASKTNTQSAYPSIQNYLNGEDENGPHGGANGAMVGLLYFTLFALTKSRRHKHLRAVNNLNKFCSKGNWAKIIEYVFIISLFSTHAIPATDVLHSWHDYLVLSMCVLSALYFGDFRICETTKN